MSKVQIKATELLSLENVAIERDAQRLASGCCCNKSNNKANMSQEDVSHASIHYDRHQALGHAWVVMEGRQHTYGNYGFEVL